MYASLLQFTFERDSAHPDTWYILNFQHMNETEDEEGERLFQYRGIKFSISAPMKKGYTCSKPGFLITSSSLVS